MVCTITEMLCVIAYQSIERNTGTTFLTTSVPCYMMLHSLTSNFWVKVWSHDQPSDSYLRLCPRKPILWAQTYITWFTWYEQLAPIHFGGVTTRWTTIVTNQLKLKAFNLSVCPIVRVKNTVLFILLRNTFRAISDFSLWENFHGNICNWLVVTRWSVLLTSVNFISL